MIKIGEDEDELVDQEIDCVLVVRLFIVPVRLDYEEDAVGQDEQDKHHGDYNQHDGDLALLAVLFSHLVALVVGQILLDFTRLTNAEDDERVEEDQ